MEHSRYVPVLMTKHAECVALHDVSWMAKQRITPLFVVAPIAWSFDLDGPAMSIGDHLAPLPERLAAAWKGGGAFIDTDLIADHEWMDDGSSALRTLVQRTDALGLALVPVTAPRRDRELDAVVTELAARDDRGLCLRLMPDEWPTRTGPVEFRQLLRRLSADPARVDLVLDLGDLSAADDEAIASAVIYELAVLPFPDAWRSIVVLGSSIPTLHGPGVRRVHRREWNVHRRLVRADVLSRRPSFGDYGVANPDPRADVDPVSPSRMVTLRHTTGNDVVIARGHPLEPTPGGGVDGRVVPPATRHHLEVVVEQLADLHGREVLAVVEPAPERRRGL